MQVELLLILSMMKFDNFFIIINPMVSTLSPNMFLNHGEGGFYPAILIGGFYVYGLSTKNLRSRQIALGATQTFVMSGITVQILKMLTHRHRPYHDDPPNPRLWEGPFTGFEYNSFPSGHSITAFALASFFSSVYKDKIWVGVLAYGIAGGVGLQRLYAGEHWASDVLIGAALGVGIGKTVFHSMNKNS